MIHRLLPLPVLLLACAEADPVVPRAARVAGSELDISLSDGRSCTLTLPGDRNAELEAPPACRPVSWVRVHAAPAPGEPVVLFQFDGEGRLDNDGPGLWVWVAYGRGTWLFSG
jgi:hypothetical protein